MEPFKSYKDVAAPLEEANVDTNQLCPTRFNKVPEGPEYWSILFHDQRFNLDGSEKPDFILNQEPYRKARILVALKNFGCGSSRETAVWGLKGFGFRALIAPSFGDIFFSNCFKNGVLPIILAEEFVVKLINQLKDQVGAQISVDLKEQTVIGPDGEVYSFKVEPLRKKCLLEGLDDISLTLQFRDSIEKFEENYYQKAPWLRPA